MVLGDVGVGLAVEESRGAAVELDGAAVEPGFPAESGDHLVDQRLAACRMVWPAGAGGAALGMSAAWARETCGASRAAARVTAKARRFMRRSLSQVCGAGVRPARCWTLLATGRLRGP